MSRREAIALLNSLSLGFYSQQEHLVKFIQENPKDPTVKKLCTLSKLRLKLKTSVFQLHRDIQWGRLG